MPKLVRNNNLDFSSYTTQRMLQEAFDTEGFLRTQLFFSDSPSIDAFGRLRISYPLTLFDSKQIFKDESLPDDVENYPLYFDNRQVSGSGSTTLYNNNTASTTLSVSSNMAGSRIRQTKMRFNYQPGKSLLVLLSFVIGNSVSGIIKREGIFDEKNGIFLEASEGKYYFVRRSYTTGSPIDYRVERKDWEYDKMDGKGPSGIDLDFTKTQILVIDYEWLGVGRVRMGFVIDGMIRIAHIFNHSNSLNAVYMSTPNLPLRSVISNDGTGPQESIVQICSTVISEGNVDPLGTIRYFSTKGNQVVAQVENTVYAIIGIRLKQSYIGESIKLIDTGVQLQTGSSRVEWLIILNPVVEGTFTYVDLPNSALQVASGSTSNTVIGGVIIGGGFVESGGVQAGSAGSVSKVLENAIQLGSNIDNSVDMIVLCARPVGGSTGVNVEGFITWRELN